MKEWWYLLRREDCSLNPLRELHEEACFTVSVFSIAVFMSPGFSLADLFDNFSMAVFVFADLFGDDSVFDDFFDFLFLPGKPEERPE